MLKNAVPLYRRLLTCAGFTKNALRAAAYFPENTSKITQKRNYPYNRRFPSQRLPRRRSCAQQSKIPKIRHEKHPRMSFGGAVRLTRLISEF